MPAFSPHDIAIKTAHDLTMALPNPHPASTLLPANAQQVQELQHLATIFAEIANLKTHNQAVSTKVPTPRVLPSPDLKESQPPPRVALLTQTDTNRQQLNDVTIASHDAPLHMANAVYDADIGLNLEYRHLICHPNHKHTWLHSAANEFGRLAQGIRDVNGTNTIKFIKRTDAPKHRTVTYGRLVCDIQRQKTEPHRTRLTVGGNLINYPGEVSSPTANLTAYKLHTNNIISTAGAKAMTMDISNFYLNSPLPRSEFMKIPIALIPQEIVEQYNLLDTVDDKGFVFIAIKKECMDYRKRGSLPISYYNIASPNMATSLSATRWGIGNILQNPPRLSSSSTISPSNTPQKQMTTIS